MIESGRDRIRFESFLKAIWHKKWVVILFVLIVMAAVYVGNSLSTPIYESSATLYVKGQTPSVLGSSLYDTDISNLSPTQELNTQLEIIKSRSVIEETIQDLKLVERFSSPGLTETERLEQAIDGVRKGLSISNITNTRLLRVAVRNRDPELAMAIANTISNTLIARNVESKRSEANAVLQFVSDQVNQVSEKLNRAEEDILKYKQTQRVTDLSEESKLMLDRLAQLENSYQQVRLDRQILNVRISAIQGQTAQSTALESTNSLPGVKPLQGQVVELEKQLASLAPGDPKADALRTEIESLGKRIQAEIEKTLGAGKGTSVNSVLQLQLAEYKSQDIILAAQEKAMSDLVSALESDVNKLSAKEIYLARLERTRTINIELYSALMKTKNESQIEAISQLGNIDVIDPAVVPLQPVSPKKQENLIVGFLLGLLLGICFAFLLDYFDHSVKTEDEIKKALGAPLIGFIPRFSRNGAMLRRKNPSVYSKPFFLVSRDEPKSFITEAFRLLRTNLYFIELDIGLKTIAVTSAVPGEGKTTVAANLAVALCAQEEKVLVIDADFRAPAVHEIFHLSITPGFTNILTDRVDPKSLIRELDGIPNLHIITCGTIPPNPAEIVGSSRMKTLIREFRKEYDRVIIDTPPILGATDAVVMTSYIDGTLIVLRSGTTDRRALHRMTEILGNAKANILGGVLNGVKKENTRYAYGSYYYGDTKS